jgi:hypothetical protein
MNLKLAKKQPQAPFRIYLLSLLRLIFSLRAILVAPFRHERWVNIIEFFGSGTRTLGGFCENQILPRRGRHSSSDTFSKLLFTTNWLRAQASERPSRRTFKRCQVWRKLARDGSCR